METLEKKEVKQEKELAKKSILDLLDNKLISEKDKKNSFEQIDNGNKKVIIKVLKHWNFTLDV